MASMTGCSEPCTCESSAMCWNVSSPHRMMLTGVMRYGPLCSDVQGSGSVVIGMHSASNGRDTVYVVRTRHWPHIQHRDTFRHTIKTQAGTR
jgi:hypothetical protein